MAGKRVDVAARGGYEGWAWFHAAEGRAGLAVMERVGRAERPGTRAGLAVC